MPNAAPPTPPVALSAWFLKKKKGTIFFNKFHTQTFWTFAEKRLCEYARPSTTRSGGASPLAAYQRLESEDVDSTAASPRPLGEDLISSFEISELAQVFKERSDELLFVFLNDNVLTLRAVDPSLRDVWFEALNASISRPSAANNNNRASTALLPRRSTLTSSLSLRRSSLAAHKERLSAHFSKAQLFAKQINKTTVDSALRKRNSKEDAGLQHDRGNGMRIVVVPSIANEEKVDPIRFTKTREQNELLLAAINRDLLPVAMSVFPAAQVTAQAVVDLMFSVQVAAHKDILVQGEASDRMYVIETGVCGVYSQDFADQPPHFEINKREGETFGLLALLYTQPAPFTIRTEQTACGLWALPRNKFFELNRNLTRRNHAHKLKLLTENLLESLERAFGVISANVLEQIADSMEFQTYRLGQVLLHKDDALNKIYIVDEGQVQGEDVTLNNGDVFGAESLVETDLCSSMTLLADSDEVVVLVISAEEIRSFFGKESAVAQQATASAASSSNSAGKKMTMAKGSVLYSKKTLKRFASSNREETEELLVFVEEIEENGERINLDIPFEKNLPRLRPEISDLDQLEFKAYLGRGQFGTVHLVAYPATAAATTQQQKELFALKVLQGNMVTLNGWEEMVQQERDAMLELAHSPSHFLCRLNNYFSDRKNIYFLLEYVDSGTLQDHMEYHTQKAEYVFQTVPVMQFYLACVVLGLEAIHSHDICYRDLKPENMMMSSNGYCKLADFGLAKKTRRTFTFCGSPQFMAPETLLNRGHGLAVDWWASGIVLFEMLCGYSPFAAFESSDTFERILAYSDQPTPALLGYPKDKAVASETALTRDLIENLLFPKQNKRLGVRFPGVSGIKKHGFFQGFDWQQMEAQALVAPFTPRAKEQPAPNSSAKKYDPNLFAVPDDMTGWTVKF